MLNLNFQTNLLRHDVTFTECESADRGTIIPAPSNVQLRYGRSFARLTIFEKIYFVDLYISSTWKTYTRAHTYTYTDASPWKVRVRRIARVALRGLLARSFDPANYSMVNPLF